MEDRGEGVGIEKSFQADNQIIYSSQTKDYAEEILNRMLRKAQNFDKGLPRINEFLVSIGQNMQSLEESH